MPCIGGVSVPLVTLNEILPQARRDGYAVAAFNVANLETLYSVVRAARAENCPLIVQVYQRLFEDDRAELIGVMARRLAEQSDAPMALHLDHGGTLDRVKQALDIGYTSVMIDGSALPFEENIALTSQAAALAHAAGATLEAEIGHVPFGDGEVKLSDAAEAAQFARQTKVDALAVSIGTAHGFYKKAPKLDIARAAQIGQSVPIPLVLHGGTGVSDEQLLSAITCGVAKINIATELQNLFIRGAAGEIERNGDNFKPVDVYLKPVEAQLFDYARAKIRTLRR